MQVDAIVVGGSYAELSVALQLARRLAAQLGCALEEGPTGPFIRTELNEETTVAGVFACGDAARPFGNVAVAVGDGALAGAFARQSLIFNPLF